MPDHNASSKSKIAKLSGLVGFSIVTGFLGPWLQGFFDLRLISDSFQPGANGIASTLAAIAFLYSYASSAKKARSLIEGRARNTGIACLVTLVSCLALRSTLEAVTPGMGFTRALWILWFVLFVSVFSLFSGALGYVTRMVQSGH